MKARIDPEDSCHETERTEDDSDALLEDEEQECYRIREVGREERMSLLLPSSSPPPPPPPPSSSSDDDDDDAELLDVEDGNSAISTAEGKRRPQSRSAGMVVMTTIVMTILLLGIFLTKRSTSETGHTQDIKAQKDTSRMDPITFPASLAPPTTSGQTSTAAQTTSPLASETTAKSNVKQPDLAIVTATSINYHNALGHMLQTLIEQEYADPLYIYFMLDPVTERGRRKELDDIIQQYDQALQETSLNYHIMPLYESKHYLKSYCFKPQVIQDFLAQCRSPNTDMVLPRTLMWSDTSVRFNENPTHWAQNMLRDDIAVATHTGHMGMGENTHPDMWAWFNRSMEEFAQYKELAATYEILNLETPGNLVEKEILEPWFACSAPDACLVCMAPEGSSKHHSPEVSSKGPPSTTYVAHRQDQSAYSILVYDFIRRHSKGEKGTEVAINNPKYLWGSVDRGGKKEEFSASDLGTSVDDP